MDNSSRSGSYSAGRYPVMDARQSLDGTFNASKHPHYPNRQQTMGIAALTPPSMPDSPPAQSLMIELMHNYLARISTHFEPTPPPETFNAAQHAGLPLGGPRDFEHTANSQARQPFQYSRQSAATESRHPQNPGPPPPAPMRHSALTATHPAQYRVPPLHAPSVWPSPDPMNARTASLMPPPPHPLRANGTPTITAPSAQTSPEPEWSANTDPSLRTHYGLPKWPRPVGLPQADCDVTHGMVASPTFMVGLPFGTTLEIANQYR